MGSLQEGKKTGRQRQTWRLTVKVAGRSCSRTKELWPELTREQLTEACCQPALRLEASKHTSKVSASTQDDSIGQMALLSLKTCPISTEGLFIFHLGDPPLRSGATFSLVAPQRSLPLLRPCSCPPGVPAVLERASNKRRGATRHLGTGLYCYILNW